MTTTGLRVIGKKAWQSKTIRQQRIIGAILILGALICDFVFTRGINASAVSTFTMNINATAIQVPDLVINTNMVLYILAGVLACLGVYQLVRGFKRFTGLVIVIAGILLIFGFLDWAVSGKSISLTGMLSVMVIRSVPITIGALAGLMCERAGVVNIAIEGMMISGAFTGAVVGSILGLWPGVFAAILVGALLALLHGVLSIKYKVDQIISGTVINIFATGLTTYLYIKYLQDQQWLNEPGFFFPSPIPLLSKIPVIGPIFFTHNLYIYSMYILVALITIILFYTRWGLRLRSVGESPKTADTLGINVFRTRYIAVILGGILAGFAGSYFSLGSAGYFEQTMTAGRGFIALAALIFGKWTPIGSLEAGLLFGFSESLTTKLSIINIPIPAELLMMVPYVFTMVVLAGVVGRSRAPAADGVPYEKESL
jgi:general nucleoside transport system permease protein